MKDHSSGVLRAKSFHLWQTPQTNKGKGSLSGYSSRQLAVPTLNILAIIRLGIFVISIGLAD